jgi:HAD superfamily hydrolase (TIGR01509 family)
MLLSRRFWIFDMDGTLTVPAHDFDAMRRELGIEGKRPLLEAIAEFAPARAARAHARIAEWEWAIARRAVAQPDAQRLCAALVERGIVLGVLTRNRSDIAAETLRAIGFDRWFEPDVVLGRDDAPAKPSPAGVHLLLDRWRARPEEAVMVGDFRFDVDAGNAAGTATVLVERGGPTPWRELPTRWVTRLDALLED